jgi:hypothetical protein
MADGTKQKAGDVAGVSPALSIPAPLIQVARLLARQAAQAHFTASEEKGVDRHDQTD